jgi:type I restriction enzyme, S subunit
VYPESEAELLERISWHELSKHPKELWFSVDFEATIRGERIDAEHYQPNLRILRDHLKKIGGKPIGNFCNLIQRGVQPTFIEDGEIAVIDSKAVRPLGVEPDKTERTSSRFFNSPYARKGRVIQDDVLLNSTGVGTLGRASFYNSVAPALADNHVTIVRPNPKVCNPVYLNLFLNSPAGLTQSEMFQTGSSGQIEIYPHNIRKILIYIPQTQSGQVDLEWQEGLADKILAAARTRVTSREKLEVAKGVIEESIS